MRETARLAVLAVIVRAVALSLRLFGYAWTARALRHRFARRGLTPFSAEHVARAAAGILPVGCLPRALVAAAILENRGDQVAVRIGVRRDGGALSAHAWVERDGVPIAEPEGIAARFAAFDRNFG
jgi:hypothetical protein